MESYNGKNSILVRPFGLALAVLATAGLTACAVPLNRADLEAYKRRQTAKQDDPAPTQLASRRAGPAVSSARVPAKSVPTVEIIERSQVRAAPVSAVSGAPVTGVSRAPLAAVSGAPLDAPPEPAIETRRKAPPSLSGRKDLRAGLVHVVAAGDTVYAISREYGVHPTKIIAHNGLPAPYTLSIGQAIKIPSAAGNRYRVIKGDTIYGIARNYGVPLRAVIDANGLAPPYRLTIGRELTIPLGRQHRVSKGETVYSIARRYEVDMSALVRLNEIAAPYTIKPAQVLVLPGRRPPTAVATTEGGRDQVRSTRVEPALAEIPRPAPRAASTFLWPVSGTVILDFGPKTDGRHNDGINIAAPRGTPIKAAENGVVAYAGNELRGFGNLLLLKHADGWVTAYAHTEGVTVRRGERVRRGQTIGRVGSSGSVAKPQLHFELRKGTRAVNPTKLLGPQTASGARL